MKKLLILFLLLPFFSVSQTLVHTKGIKGFAAAYHYTPKGFAGSVSYKSFFHEKLFFKGSLNYEKGSVGFTDFDVYLFNPALNYSPYNVDQKIFFNTEVGAIVGWENRLPKFDYPLETKFIYGFNILIESEYFILPSLSLNINYSQLLTLGSDFGMFRFQLGAGLSHYF